MYSISKIIQPNITIKVLLQKLECEKLSPNILQYFRSLLLLKGGDPRF